MTTTPYDAEFATSGISTGNLAAKAETDTVKQALVAACKRAIPAFQELVAYLRKYGDSPELARACSEELVAASALASQER